MSKVKSVFVCQVCGSVASKWSGKCSNCGEWNSLVEEIVEKPNKNQHPALSSKTLKSYTLDEVPEQDNYRIITTDNELNRVLGGGIVPGSLVLLGGEPGIGKSTLLLQMALQAKGLSVLYVSGEESERQIKMRADRISFNNEKLYLFTNTIVENIIHQITQLKVNMVVIDSIQTLQTQLIDAAPGSISQIRETTHILQQYAKQYNIPIFIIGHITKEGIIAGPKLLEHMVDTVLQFEGDRNYNYRIIRTIKNRFGSTAELGIYEMQSSGLRPVSNPSELLITERDEKVSGIAIAATIEGMRALLVEVQALVSPAVYGTPQRSSTGYDLRRLNMLLAVLDKRCGFKFGTKDVFLNIAGGLRIEDPATDLAVVAALLSSYNDIAIDNLVCFSGEVGLSGEIRAVNKVDIRIAEAEKLGYHTIYISKYNKKLDKVKSNVQLLKNVIEFYKLLV
ncbi:MAG: DNA repair protein RadA [Chitinophagales bacterium]|nr:DNA repair protein RadA [Chitinophagales bacterium]